MADTYRLKRCRECGFPRYLDYLIRWNDNGTITHNLQNDFRGVIQHYSFIHGLLPRIGSQLGLSIDHIAFEAQRNASNAVFQALYDKRPSIRFSCRFGFVKRLVVEQFNKMAVATGMCYSNTLEYVPGKYGVARIKNPFDINLMAANVVGGFEVLEGMPFKHSLEQEGDDSYVIRVEATGEKPEISERMALEYPTVLPGNRQYEKCSRCHAPRAIGSLKWMENEGTILDKLSGDRVVVLDGYMISAVFREMAKELGDEVNDILVDAQKDWVIDHAEQLGLVKGEVPLSGEARGKAYRDYMDLILLYGQGNPTALEIGDSQIKVEIENPYEPMILAGSLQGLFEAIEKVAGGVTWESVKEGAVTYAVQPA